MSEQITLYSNVASPYTHGVELALLEAKVNFKKFEVNLKDKPEWYTKVNPVGQVPAITYGGPDVPPDQPSPESVKLRESTILLEFIAERFPEARLLPQDLVLRAKARLFIDIAKTKLLPAWFGCFRKGEPVEAVFVALEQLQELLPPTGFVVGEWSIADAYISGILPRAEIVFENNLNQSGWTEGQGQEIMAVLRGPRFARLTQYTQDLTARPSFKATFDKPAMTDMYKRLFASRAAAQKQ
ncbi:hypothetical protein CERSUDRAFT_113980 [Gelatoporia subvermispora B]|uniref:GST N-terminal domain-containing protein n=1 Tax=Ceriporiopsis subvermispora (strain B) TaxID=914234 RepID=M2RFT8_CERS8|nr:hypothetical protein CERSUDRAFT_113980 [Gelatoporia subvermispora B]